MRAPTPDEIHAFVAPSAEFGDALERLIALAETIVSTGDDTDVRRYPDLNWSISPLVTQAFITTDRAAWLMMLFVTASHGSLGAWPVSYSAAMAGHGLYASTMAVLGERWGCGVGIFRGVDGVEWIGRHYSGFTFLADHSVRPRELDRFKMALKLVRLEPPAAGDVQSRPLTPEPDRTKAGRIVPVLLGDSHAEVARVLTPGGWVETNLTADRFKVLKAMLEMVDKDPPVLDTRKLNTLDISRDVIRGMRKHETLKHAVTEPKGPGSGYGLWLK